MPAVENGNLTKVIKRLELIKSLISLQKEDEIASHVSKLEQTEVTPELEKIVKLSDGESRPTNID